MSTADMDAPTHAVIEATDAMPSEKLGKFDGALFPLQVERFTPLGGIVLMLKPGHGYRAYSTDKHKEVSGRLCVVYHVNPIPERVEVEA